MPFREVGDCTPVARPLVIAIVIKTSFVAVYVHFIVVFRHVVALLGARNWNGDELPLRNVSKIAMNLVACARSPTGGRRWWRCWCHWGRGGRRFCGGRRNRRGLSPVVLVSASFSVLRQCPEDSEKNHGKQVHVLQTKTIVVGSKYPREQTNTHC